MDSSSQNPTRAAAAVRRRGKNPYPDSPGLSNCEPCDNGSVQAESLPVRPLRPCAVEKRIPTQTPAAISNLEPCDNGDVQRAVRPLRPCAVEERIPTQTPPGISSL